MEEILKVVLNTLGGVSVVLTGLFAYFGNLRLEKIKADLTETNTKLKAALESSVHVSKAQFDKEFVIYQQIWVLLVSLRAKTLSLRPVMDRVDPKEAEEERMQRRLKEFGAAFYAFRDSMEENRPFYAHSVYECLVEIFDICGRLVMACNFENGIVSQLPIAVGELSNGSFTLRVISGGRIFSGKLIIVH